ncbi:uncharacterized protein N7496_007430 [Penicillium cataractarum]|uniref:Uncharacterized protein n=1 Tax=Penicillium cataractarum TaxID=2100454 RepID=A0A9W9S833_9EURO|nr:uncharacterized protein N7496_007430 [Penicillium cataractarum]KAJ5371338.1 hypothetical protein N7496_007430 [Penicillium cataractarum]
MCFPESYQSRKTQALWELMERWQTIHPGIQEHTPPDPAATVSGPGASFSNLRNDAIPPSEIGVFLLETYFGRIFNASFLFHQPSFTNDYRRGNVKEHVYLSIFAVASL